jgi:hypothetical protein
MQEHSSVNFEAFAANVLNKFLPGYKRFRDELKTKVSETYPVLIIRTDVQVNQS